MERQQCLHYHVLSTILITNCDEFFLPSLHYFHVNKPKIHGEWLQCGLMRLFCGDSGTAVGAMVRWCRVRLEQYFPAAELSRLPRSAAGFT